MDYFHLNLSSDQIRTVSNLGLAHVGDGVFEVMVRSWLCIHGKATNRGLHKATVQYVAAPAQARAAGKILPLLTPEEADVFRRGRNTTHIRYQGQPAGRSIKPPRQWKPCSGIFG